LWVIFALLDPDPQPCLQARVLAAENKNNITTFILPVEQKTSGQ
jgi:hypothetical protein